MLSSRWILIILVIGYVSYWHILSHVCFYSLLNKISFFFSGGVGRGGGLLWRNYRSNTVVIIYSITTRNILALFPYSNCSLLCTKSSWIHETYFSKDSDGLRIKKKKALKNQIHQAIILCKILYFCHLENSVLIEDLVSV